jgi:hypothetical protein
MFMPEAVLELLREIVSAHALRVNFKAIACRQWRGMILMTEPPLPRN